MGAGVARLYLAQHGSARWRVHGRETLDRLGIAQAAALARLLLDVEFAAAYACPLPDARHTANIIAAVHGIEVRPHVLLRDLDRGPLWGFGPDLARLDPDLAQAWRERPEGVRFPGGEGLADLRRRIRRVIATLAERHADANVLAVTYDAPMRVAASLALGIDDSHYHEPHLAAPLASLSIIVAGPRELRLESHAEVAHLARLGEAT